MKWPEDEVLFALCAVHIGMATPEQVNRAAGKKAHRPDAVLADLLESDGVLNAEQRAKIEQWVRFELSEGQATVEIQPDSIDLPREERRSTVDAHPDRSTGEIDESLRVQLFDDFGNKVTQAEPERYSERGVHATGGQARILLAFDEHIGREVALKEFAPAERRSGTKVPGAVRSVVRFLREARVTGQLEHPNIVPVHEVGKRENGSLYYTMRLVRGETLEQKLLGCRTLSDRLKMLGVFWDVCKAIAFAHSRGVVHRDIKPENVMVGELGETVVIDWGVAKVKGKSDIRADDMERQVQFLRDGSSRTTLVGTTIGTPAYMSPEQASGKIDEVDERSDVWGLGAMLYEILTGAPPYVGATTQETIAKVGNVEPVPVTDLVPEAPPELVAVTHKSLQQKPDARYQSAKEVAEEVSAYMTGGRVRAYEYSGWELFKRFASKNRTAFGAAVLAFAVVVAALVTVSVSLQREQVERRMANFHLAEAYAEKAERLMDDLRTPSAQVFASASLLFNPAHPQSPFHTPGFSSQEPRSMVLLAKAASTIYRARRAASLELTHEFQAGDLPFQLAYSPDGKRLAAACIDRSVQIFDVAGRAPPLRLEGHRGRVHGLAYSPDGRYLASASYDQTLILWDAVTGRRLRTFSGHGDRVTRAGFSPDSNLLASASFDGTARIWDVATGSTVQILEGHAGRVRDAAFSPDGRRVATSGVDRTVRIWDVGTGKQLHELTGHTKSVARVRFSPKGGLLASGGYDGKVRFWDMESGEPLATLEGHTGHIYSLAFSPDGAWLATGSFDTSVRLWDVESRRPFLKIQGHLAAVSGLAFSPDGHLLASSGYDKNIKIWKIRRGQPPPVLTGHTDKIYAMSFSKDGTILATGSWDKTIRLWDLATRRSVSLLEGHTGYVNSVVIRPGAKQLASTSWDGTVKVWDLDAGRPMIEFRGHGGLINPAVYSPDGHLLACGHGNKDIGVWQSETFERLQVLHGHQDKVYALAFSPDGARLASAGHDKTVRIWDPREGSQLVALSGHRDLITGLDWSPDGKWIASSGSEAVAILWDARTGQEARRLEGHALWVNSVRFSPDARLLATASDDRTVRIWSTETGEPLLILYTEKEVMAVRFSPDGRSLVLGDEERVLIHDLDFSALHADPRELLNEAQRDAGKKLTGFELQIVGNPGAI